ncbi:hypothetical protein KPH14_005574 [Odynerus spinipes]|uniref:Uncharacterized protein n=1 Tax=Odynerus spinipes TaxID=1348599 RepID=A0AAD9RFA2_9HYME|nr:hypothetical protein KPH14_005574 [Odynerus spinipes]
MRGNIVNAAAARSDTWGDEVLNRISLVEDLVIVKARYHTACYPRFFNRNYQPETTQNSTPHIIDIIQQFIDDNPGEQQFSLKRIIDDFQSGRVNNQWIKRKLYERLGDDIFITSNPGSEPIIFLRD